MNNSDVEPTPIFVGREKELRRFRRLLARRRGPWLLWVEAPAGNGKSRLLEAILAESEAAGHVTSKVFDLFDDGLRTRPGILFELAKRFGVADQEELSQTAAHYQAAADKGDKAGKEHTLDVYEAALVRELKRRVGSGRRGVIALDTVELISGLRLSDWLFTKFLPRLKPEFVVVACGRQIPERAVGKLAEEGVRIKLGDLSVREVGDYLRQRLPRDFDGSEESQKLIEHIRRITRGEGQALLVAMLAHRIGPTSPSTTGAEILGPGKIFGLKKAELPKLLVHDLLHGPKYDSIRGPALASTLHSRVVSALTHVLHGLDTHMLRELMTPAELGTDDYRSILLSLHGLPYIKHHQELDVNQQEVDVVRVHDYFGERASEYWQTDEERAYRSRISSKLLPHFEALLKREGESVSPRRDRLTQQYLYHLLFADRERAYGELWATLDRVWHGGRYDYMEALLTMADRVNEMGQFDKILDRLVKAARAWMNLEVWEMSWEKVDALAQEVINDSAGVQRVALTAKVAKATAIGRSGRIQEAIDLLNVAFSEYEELLQQALAAAEGDEHARSQLTAEHGITTIEGIRPERYLILNTIGNLERRRAHFANAQEAFHRSYELSKAEGDRRWQASAATQVGSAFHYRGRIPQAYDWIFLGLALRRELDIPDQTAFALSALGKLQRDTGKLNDARQSMTEALSKWMSVDATYDIATMLLELGYVEAIDDKDDEADEYFRRAELLFNDNEGLRGLIPNLREKQGKSYIRRAKRLMERGQELEKASALLKEAENYLEDGRREAEKSIQQLYLVNCLVALCRIAEMRGEYDRISDWSKQVRELGSKFEFGPAIAELEHVLGDVAFRKAMVNAPDYDIALFDEATDRYLRMFVTLVNHNAHFYRQQREFLRRWLPTLPSELRNRAGNRLMEGWERLLGPELAAEHDGFGRTIKTMCNI